LVEPRHKGCRLLVANIVVSVGNMLELDHDGYRAARTTRSAAAVTGHLAALACPDLLGGRARTYPGVKDGAGDVLFVRSKQHRSARELKSPHFVMPNFSTARYDSRFAANQAIAIINLQRWRHYRLFFWLPADAGFAIGAAPSLARWGFC